MFSVISYAFYLSACEASFSTETVMQMCHGKRRCTLNASSSTFGNPCSPQSHLYLRVVYTCGNSLMTLLIMAVGIVCHLTDGDRFSFTEDLERSLSRRAGRGRSAGSSNFIRQRGLDERELVRIGRLRRTGFFSHVHSSSTRRSPR